MIEPVAGNMGTVAPAAGYLEGLRKLTAEAGSLLIFDEVMTGFRLAFGGAQQLFGVTPDLTCLGKVIGGGMPLGGLRRSCRNHGQRGAPGAGVPSGHALRQSIGSRSRHGHREAAQAARPLWDAAGQGSTPCARA